MLNKVIKFFLENKLLTVLLLLLFILWGIGTAPFDWDIPFLPRDPVPVDAIPDIGENQQIVFSEWMGRSPQDIEDQVTFPLTASLLGISGVKSIRSTSMFGFSSIYIIFAENVEYYWSRARVLEKINSLPADLLPSGVTPLLGPDATALGQVFWYTLEGRDEQGLPAGGWDLYELRTIQDFYVRYALMAVEGVSEVASVGGFVKEYQVDVDPTAMKAKQVSIMDVVDALRKSNQDLGASTVEINLVEYYVRGLGYVKSLEDIEQTAVKVYENTPIRIRDIAKVNYGPAPRNHGGILDKGGSEAVGGVVVARFAENPLKVIDGIKRKITEIAPGLHSRTLADGRVSRVTIVPFYDRSQLIRETLGTLYEAISLQILITIIVIMVMVFNLRASLLISGMLPLAVLMSFIMMKLMKVDANIVALSGIAIAIGTMVDLGIILNENVLRHRQEAPAGQSLLDTVYNAAAEVSSAILTAVSTTIVSFLPVFTLQAAEGKLFRPLAFTKTFALVAALLVSLLIMPAFSHWLLSLRLKKLNTNIFLNALLLMGGIVSLFLLTWAGLFLTAVALNNLLFYSSRLPENISAWQREHHKSLNILLVVLAVSWLLTLSWLPLGAAQGNFLSFIFILLIIGLLLGAFKVFLSFYPRILAWCLGNKLKFLLLPLILVFLALNIWLGVEKVLAFPLRGLGFLGLDPRSSATWNTVKNTFPGLGREFMPALDEGAFLLMPTSMPHSGVEVNQEYLKQLDLRVQSIPEVEMAVGKAGRVASALDPAPFSMFENIIIYKSEYLSDQRGYPLRFKTEKNGDFARDDAGKLIPARRGRYYRQWRPHIKSADDIWAEVVRVTSDIPGLTSAPRLQPIETRLVMLQTGMRAPIGIKVYGPDLQTIEEFSLKLENLLEEVPAVKPGSVFADRSLGKPYLEIDLDRRSLARHGLGVGDVQHYLEFALGGMNLSTTVEGRERFNIRGRYAREWRDDPHMISRILIPTAGDAQIPLAEIAEIRYRSGPMMIRGENAFLVGYILLDKKEGFAELTVVEQARDYLEKKISSGELEIPPGVSYHFSGNYENQVRAARRLALVMPLVLFIIFLILYFQFRSAGIALMIFSAVALAFAGAFIMIWLYSRGWFLDFSFFGTEIRDVFQVGNYNLSVAVWVGFIALFGIATDDGVVVATYLDQSFRRYCPGTVAKVREAVLQAGLRRVRPCLMTTATTILALLPVLSSTGKGADIMIPMAIPVFGGMSIALITLFVVPVLYSAREERFLKKRINSLPEEINNGSQE